MEEAKFRHVCPSETSGYLVKARKFPPSRRKYFYRLNGAVLTRHHSEDSVCREKVVVIGAFCRAHSHNGFNLTLQRTHYIFYARNEIECEMWIEALNEASKFRLERFYDVRQVIGVGGFAEVRIAYDLETEAKVAVKTIKKSGQTDAFLQRELNIMRKLDHPHVVRTYDIFESLNKYHIVMEYLSGGSLFDVMTPHTRFHEEDVRKLMHQVLKGLAYIHSQDIAHRDLKPENILLAGGKPPHHAKIADFGLSKFFNTASDELMKTMIGTPQFVAPELVKNEEYGSGVDLWACGIITYNMLTGEIPFTEKSVLELYRKGDVKIQYGSEWKRISSKAQSLTRMLLCVNPSTRINAIGAVHHRWFTDSEQEDSETDCAQKKKQSRMNYARSRGARSKVSLGRVRQYVHAVRFLQRLLAKAGNSKFFKTKATVLYDHPKQQDSRISVGTTEDSEWDFIVQDVSVGQMDSIPLSPPASPRNAMRKQTLATRQSDASMISLVTPQAADGSPRANFDEVPQIPSVVPTSKNSPSHQIKSPSISQSSYGDRSRSTANQKSHGIGRNFSPSRGVNTGSNMQVYRSNTAVVAGSMKERAFNCERNKSQKPSSVYSARGSENAMLRQKMQSEIRMSSMHDTLVHEHANSDLFTPSVLPLNQENMWLSADAVDPSDSIHYSNTYNESDAMQSNSASQADNDERAVDDTRARRRPKVKEMTRRLLGGLRMGRKNKENPSENSS